MGLIVTITCADEVRREKSIFATGHFASFSTQSNDNGIVAAKGFSPMRHDGQGRPILPNPLSSNPPNVVIVEVGPKPLPESLKMKPLSRSGARGNKMWGNTAE
jgi:hypothetical protein